jgi:plasmid stability protein
MLTPMREGAIIDIMRDGGSRNQLIVRNLDEAVVRELKLRAARHGRSAEAEHREILRQTLLPAEAKRPLKDLLLAIPGVGEDADFERVRDLGRDVDL